MTQRISDEDNPQREILIQAIVELADGNMGAATAVSRMVQVAIELDPDSILGSYAPIIALDNRKIYGPRIWVLFKDICGEDPRWAVTVLRATQLGLLDSEDLDAAIDCQRDSSKPKVELDLPKLLADLRMVRPGFWPEEAEDD